MTAEPRARPPRPAYRYGGRPEEVLLLARPNRYRARVRRPGGGRPFDVHVPNPGRMEELLVPGSTRGYVVRAPGPTRKTAFDLVAVRHGRSLVSIDPRASNRLARAALERRWLTGAPAGPWSAEVRWGRSRLDFGRRDPQGRLTALLEVKSSNLRVGSTALFPDAPTLRGTRHLEELVRARRAGRFAGVLFVVQRRDVRSFAPNRALDPAFARAFDRARAAGVRVWAISLRVRPGRLEWGTPLHVRPRLVEERL